MTGYASFCDDESSVNALLCEHDTLNHTLRQASNGGEGLARLILTGTSTREQDFTNLALIQKSHKANLTSGFSLPYTPRSMQGITELNSSCVSSARPVVAAGCAGNVNIALNMVTNSEPVTAECAQRSSDLALSIIPYSEPVNRECACLNTEFACSCTLHSNPGPTGSRHNTCPTLFSRPDLEQGRLDICMLSNPYRQPNTTGYSRRYVYDPCLTQPVYAHRGSNDACLNNPLSHARATGEQSLPASASRYVAKKGGKSKQETEGFPLPDSLAKSFDSSEIDKIAQAIVRVNEFGSSTATENSSKRGASSQSLVFARSGTDNMPSSVQASCDGRGMANLENTTPRLLPSVGAFTVQCAKCFKWRLIPSKEQYEQIRQSILEKPFFCSSSSLWQPGASCDDPPELCEDKKLVWAIDKPNIPLAPSGWERLLVIRSEGCSKFADIYYVAPSGKKLRSMPEIERYLSEHPELVNEGVSLSQFSFVIPRSLNENYCRKKTSGSPTVMRGSVTHKSAPTNNLGVRSQPLKMPYLRKFPAQPFDSASQILGGEQLRLNCADNPPLAIEPLRAWDPDHNTLTLGYHAGLALENTANAGGL